MAITMQTDSPSRNATFERKGTFRFLDLPAELRNHVYHYALEHIRQRIVCRLYVAYNHLHSRSKSHQVTISYLGLSQSCKEIRREFRPLWLRAHVISLKDAELYLRSFPDTTSMTLYVVPYTYSDSDFDILPLLKALAAKPSVDITIKMSQDMQDAGSSSIGPLMAVFGNRNEKWLQHITGGDFSYVSLCVYEDDALDHVFFQPEECNVRLFIVAKDRGFYRNLEYDAKDSGGEHIGLDVKGLEVDIGWERRFYM